MNECDTRSFLDRLNQDLEQIATWQGGDSQRSAPTHKMNESEFRFSADSALVKYDEVIAFCSSSGSTITMRFDVAGQLDVTFRCSEGRLIIINHTGDWDYAPGAKEARDDGDVRRVYELIGDAGGEYVVNLRNDALASGFHWIGSAEALRGGQGRGWFTPVRELAAASPLPRLVVNDLSERVLQLRGMVVHGPSTLPPAPTVINGERWQSAEGYRQSFHTDSHVSLPQPAMFEPAGSKTNDVESLRRLFSGLCAAVAWLWLAKKIEVTASEVVLEFEGVRSTLVTVTALPDGSGYQGIMELWTWATSSTDVLRYEAAQQAASFSVGTARDLETAAPHVLRTGRYLARLATQGAVAEALATRRTARETASATARSTSEFVQQTARTFVDRLVAALVGWVAVYIGYQEALVEESIVSVLLWAILLVLVLTFLSALLVDYSMARATLQAVKKDLDSFQDILTGHDIESIKKSGTFTTAERKLRHAAIGLTVVFLIAVFAWTMGRLYLVGCPDWRWLSKSSFCSQGARDVPRDEFSVPISHSVGPEVSLE